VARKLSAMDDEIFESSTRSSGDVAGVFEYDGETGYFYLYDLSREKGKQVAGSIHVISDEPDFTESDISIVWNNSQDGVGLYIHDRLWAAFDLKGRKYGGNYEPGGLPAIPDEVTSAFE
jgi:hypothetical protein